MPTMFRRFSFQASWLCLAGVLAGTPAGQTRADDPRDEASLPRGAKARLGTLWLRHLGGIRSVALTVDGKVVASGGEDTRVRLWDVATGQPRGVLRDHTKPVRALAFAADGRRLVSLADGKELCVWDVASRKILFKLTGGSDDYQGAALTADGRTVALTAGSQVWLWDVAARKQRLAFAGSRFVVFSPDGKTLATHSADFANAVSLRDSATGKERIYAYHQDADGIQALAFSADGKLLATGGKTSLRIWEATERDPKFPDENRCKQLAEFKVGEVVVHIAFAPDGKRVFFRCAGTIRIGDPSTGKEILKRPVPRGEPGYFSFSPRRKLFATWANQVVRLAYADTGKEVPALPGHTGTVQTLRFAANGKTLISFGHDGTVRHWDLAQGRETRRKPAEESWEGVSPDGKLRASGYNAYLRVIDTADDKVLLNLASKDLPGECFAFAPDSKRLAHASQLRGIVVREMPSGQDLKVRFEEAEKAGPRHLAFSADGRFLAAAGDDQTVRVWKVAGGQPVKVLTGHKGPVLRVAFTADGKRLASGGTDGTVRVWDLTADREPKLLRGHLGPVTALAFAPGGRSLATGSQDTTILLWELP